MTIFDKLSGFAHKAKENALSRAILAKDKRLDKSLSESLDATHIGLSKMSSFGIPGRVSAVAYDPVCGLLAIGGGVEPDTYIRIFGKGISTSLTLSSATRIKYLQFQTGSPTLVAVDMKNIVTTYDLKTKRARHVVATPSIVTSLAHCTGTDWLFIGFADGNVDMFDMEAGAFGEEYGIPNLCLDEDQQQQQQQQNQQQNPSPPPHNVVVAIQMHPADLDLVLVGYDSAVFLWSIRDQNIKKCFIVPQRASSKEEIRLTCLTWSPCGTRFMAGYDNGYMHLWDTRNDHKSLLARRVFHAGSPTEESPCEPIYNMAWYVDDTARKSFLVVAGGSDLPDIRGLHVLEYDLDTSDLRDARKQTILSTSVDVSDFILLNSEPYFLGMHNPLGLLLVGTDGAVRAYGLDHGHPHLVLPPALQFLDPPVEQAYYLSQLPHKVFQELIAPPSRVPQRRDLYLPLTGGIAGNGHIYRIPSNDLLLTVHGKSTLRFWDASYTSLRPLSSRTIDCSEVLESKNNSNNCNIQHVVLDHHTGTILLAMEDNAILVFIPDAVEEKQSPGAGQQQHHSDVQQKFIDNCEETLDEITQLLEDMNNVEEEDVSQPPPASTDDTAHQQHSEATPPLPPRQSSTPPTQRESDQQLQEQPKELKQSPNDENNPFVESTQPSPSSPPPQQQQQQQTEVIATEAETTTTLIEEKSPGVKIDLLDIPIERSGFTLTMKVSVEDGTITKMVSGEKSLFAFSTSNARTFVIDRLLGQVIFSFDIKGDNGATTVATTGSNNNDTNSISTEGSGGKEASVKSAPGVIPSDISVDQIALYTSYSPSNLKTFQTVPQLYIGLSNGSTYQHDITVPSSQPILIPSTSTTTSIIDIHMIDIYGNPPQAGIPATITEGSSPTSTMDDQLPPPRKSSEQLSRKSEDSGRQSKDDTASVKSDISNKSNSGGAAGLLRKTTRKFSKSANRNRSNSQSTPPPPLPNQQDMPPIPTSEEPNELNSPVSNTGSKRVTAGRWEYNQQPNPHFLVVVSTKSVATFLSGYNTRLFQNDLQSTQGCTEQDVIVGSKIMKADEGNGTCLCVVLQGGNVIFYSLPHLNPIAKITLPADVVANRRLDDMSLSADGRMVVWSAPFELDQYLVLLQTNLPHGEAVVLHNPSIRMPPHPVQETAAQKPKKSWLDTVQSAFQKGPLTVTEFDKIMGKKPRVDPMKKAAMAKAAAAQSSSSAGGSGGSNTAKAQEESSGVGGVFKELGMKMNERGERLSELETKFEDMNQASGDFLKAVRDYNERQARKKWWEL